MQKIFRQFRVDLEIELGCVAQMAIFQKHEVRDNLLDVWQLKRRISDGTLHDHSRLALSENAMSEELREVNVDLEVRLGVRIQMIFQQSQTFLMSMSSWRDMLM